MTKLTTPLLSLDAHGTLANQITVQTTNRQHIARTKPTPTDPKTPAQLFHRQDYQHYVAFWNTLSTTLKAQYKKSGNAAKMPALAYYLKNALPYPDNIIAHYLFQEPNGSTTHDSSPYKHTGIIYGATHVPGYSGNALYFDGTNDYVAPGSIHPVMTKGTLLARFKRTIKTGYQMILTDNSSYLELCFSGNSLQFYVHNTVIQVTNTVTDWQFAVGTFSQTDNYMRLYLGNSLIASGTYPGSTNAETSFIGGRGAVLSFKGDIDEVAILSEPLTISQIQKWNERGYPV